MDDNKSEVIAEMKQTLLTPAERALIQVLREMESPRLHVLMSAIYERVCTMHGGSSREALEKALGAMAAVERERGQYGATREQMETRGQ